MMQRRVNQTTDSGDRGWVGHDLCLEVESERSPISSIVSADSHPLLSTAKLPQVSIELSVRFYRDRVLIDTLVF